MAERPKPPVRPAYLEAIARYEQALAVLQVRQFDEAAGLLRSVLADYPDEKELHERVRLYLNVCERHQVPRAATPLSSEERIYAATIALNSAAYEDALQHLQAVLADDPDNDHALYMLAVVHTTLGRLDEAAGLLHRAVDLNPDNRALARNDADLEPLRSHDSVRQLLEPPLGGGRRRSARARGTR